MGGKGYALFRDSSGNWYLYELDGGNITDKTPSGSWSSSIGYLRGYRGKGYALFRDSSGNRYLYELDGGNITDKTPSGSWKDIGFLREYGGKGYIRFLDSSGNWHLYELENGNFTDKTPPFSWKKIGQNINGVYRKDIYSMHLAYSGVNESKGYFLFTGNNKLYVYPASKVALSLNQPIIHENGGTATVTAELSAPATYDVTVNLTFAGTATEDTDYTVSTHSIIINAGDTQGTATLTGLHDPTPEGDETIIITIESVTGDAVAGTAKSVTATITETILPTVQLSIDKPSFLEDGGVATVTATLSAAAPADVTVNLTFGGSATVGTDYTASTQSITIPAGNTQGTTTLTGITDSLTEGDETIIVSIDTIPTSNAIAGGVTSVTATLIDVPPPSTPNQIKNPGFETGLAPWQFRSPTNDATGQATSTNANTGTSAVEISFTQDNSARAILVQDNLTLDFPGRYRLTFYAKASTAGRPLEVRLMPLSPPPPSYGTFVGQPIPIEYKTTLTTSWTQYSVEIDTANFTGTVTDARLAFVMRPGVWFSGDLLNIDDVVLEKI